MELRYVANINEAEKSITLLLYGAIGDKIDGDYFAQEINYLGTKYDEIIVRINSEGGNVLQGLSIFNALINSPAFIVINIDGVAASMAGVIAMAGDMVRMNDFARIMVHNPLIPNRTNYTNKEKKTLENIGGMLNDILSRRGVEKDKMADFMSKESWFKAEEALALKLIDEIVPTGKAHVVESALANVAAISDKHFQKFIDIPKQTGNMKLIASLFGLSESANESEVISKIKALQAENATLTNQVTEIKALADQLKIEKATSQKAQVETLADGAIKNGFFTKEQREALLKMGEESFTTFKAMIEGIKKPASTSLTNALNQGGEKPEEKHDFEWYRRNDPQALAVMKIAEPDRFEKLANAWEEENK